MCLTEFKLNEDKFQLHLTFPINLSPPNHYVVLAFRHLPRASLAEAAGLNGLPLTRDGPCFVAGFVLFLFFLTLHILPLLQCNFSAGHGHLSHNAQKF